MAKKLSAALGKAKLAVIFGELAENPPQVLAKTAAKKGQAATDKQRIAIALSKARDGGVNVKKKPKSPKPGGFSKTGGVTKRKDAKQ